MPQQLVLILRYIRYVLSSVLPFLNMLQAGTIVHETSHFTSCGGTDDYVYGQSECKDLAKDRPGEAVMNADSHEYFAENDPSED